MQPNELQVKKASQLIMTELLGAISRGRWIDDLLVLELSRVVQEKMPKAFSPTMIRKVILKSILAASEFFNLGVQKKSLERLKVL